MKATVTTYKNAVMNGFCFVADTAYMADFEWLPVEPKMKDTALVINTKNDEGVSEFYHAHTLVKVACTCGNVFATAIDQDNNSGASIIHCYQCDTDYHPEGASEGMNLAAGYTLPEYTLDDSINFRRAIASAKKGK